MRLTAIGLALAATTIGSNLQAQAADRSSPAGGFTASGIWYRTVGTGRPIVLIHGSNLDSRSMAPLGERLARTNRVVLIDLRLHGHSRDDGGPFAFDRDVLSVLDALSLDRATIVGHSLGAIVALDLALAHPERVDRLVLVGPGISGLAPTRAPTGFDSLLVAIKSGDTVRVGAALSSMPAFALVRRHEADSLVRAMLAANTRLLFADRSRVVPTGAPAIGRLAELNAPTLVLIGERDPTEADVAADRLASQVKSSRRETVAGCGHLVPLECADDVAQLIVRFLER